MSSSIGTTGIPAFLNALDYAREGIDKGVQSFDQVAQRVAGAAGDPSAVSAQSQIDAIGARNQVAASAKVFQTGDEVLGTLLNLRA